MGCEVIEKQTLFIWIAGHSYYFNIVDITLSYFKIGIREKLANCMTLYGGLGFGINGFSYDSVF